MKVLDLFSGYTIDESGDIRNKFGKIIKTQISNSGYARVELGGKKYSVHRLMAMAFVLNPCNKPFVNHIDGNKTNNVISNLEWVTRRENQLHAYKTGLQSGYKRSTHLSESHKKALCGSRWKHTRYTYTLEGEIFNLLDDASKYFRVCRQTILNRCNSNKWPNWKKHIVKERDINV